MKTRATTWAAWIVAVLVLVTASNTASASSVLLSPNSCLGKNTLEGGLHRGSAAVSAETCRGYSQACSCDAAGLFVAPRGNGGFSGHRGFELGNHPLQPVRNSPTTIGQRQFSGHALDQMQNRGIPPSVVENTIQHGVPFPGNRPGTQGFYDPVNRVRVIINSDNGTVVTVMHGGG
jgi:hypothetical protein